QDEQDARQRRPGWRHVTKGYQAIVSGPLPTAAEPSGAGERCLAIREELRMSTILIIVLLIVLLGGGGGYYGYRSYGGAGLGGVLGLILVVLLVVWLVGG